MRRQYPFHLIEPRWQRHWEAAKTFKAFNPGESVPAGHPFAQRHGSDAMSAANVQAARAPAKFYILDMFPYPSGAGLHVGHPEGYTATDILARYRRAQGRHVLHPMGWDAFGLPAEQYAVKTGQHPRITTEQNVANFTRQIKSLGFSYDWSREVNTTDPGYFKWTQWIFLQLYNAWFNPETNRAEPISTLKYPPEMCEDAANVGQAASLSPASVRERAATPPDGSANVAGAGTGDSGQGHASGAGDGATDRQDACPTLETRRRAYRDSKRLAYVSEAPVNWCPELGTVLANEEVIDGKSEVGGFPVVRKPMRQWMLRITAFAQRLLDDLDTIDWSDSLKEMQRNWIGRSEGAEVTFQVAGAQRSVVEDLKLKTEDSITVFTTRPDTLFGATYMVLSPEHRLVTRITTPEQAAAVREYQTTAASKSDLERTELAKEKTGVFTGACAINPVNGEKIPIWIADYVLASYGTGAIMAVPAHDERDLEFAKKFELPIVQVVQPPDANSDWQGFVGNGTSVNSASAELSLDGLPTAEAKKKITAWLESKGLGKKTVNFKLRDWLFSRQRYWGEPFPIIWRKDADGALYHEALPESALPVLPPTLEDYKPTADGQPPLARATDWMNLPDGSIRETNTMPQWAGSCWYYLRYLDATNDSAFLSQDVEGYWMGSTPSSISRSPSPKSTPGVDLYVGGTEHAVLHLLYARFWHKVLFDLGHVSTSEPFSKLVNQGLILGELEFTEFYYPDGSPCSAGELKDIEEEATAAGKRLVGKHKSTGERIPGRRVADDEVEKTSGGFALKANTSILVDARSFKMSKARGNVVNPDVIIREFGADSLRLYEMFMGPLQDSKPWSTKGVEGVYRFLGRVWRLFIGEQSEKEFELAETTAAEGAREELLGRLRLSGAVRDAEPTPAQLKTLHACIRKVTEDLEGLRFNTAISAMMVFVNDATAWETRPIAVLKPFLQLLAPFAPHLAEELWAMLHTQFGRTAPSLSYEPWPEFDPALLVEDTIEFPVQVNGKLRDKITLPVAATRQDLEAAALACDKVKSFLDGKTVKKIIVVPGKLVNIVAA